MCFDYRSPRFLQTTWAPPEAIVPLGPQLSFKDFLILTLKKTLKDHLRLLACWKVAVILAKHPRGAYGFLTEVCGFNKSNGFEFVAPYLNALPHAVSFISRLLFFRIIPY